MKLYFQAFAFVCVIFPLPMYAQSVPAPTNQNGSPSQPTNQTATPQCTYSPLGEEVVFNGKNRQHIRGVDKVITAKASIVEVDCGEFLKEYFLRIRHISDDTVVEELHYLLNPLLMNTAVYSSSFNVGVRANRSLILSTVESRGVRAGEIFTYTFLYRDDRYIVSGISFSQSDMTGADYNAETGEDCSLVMNACDDETELEGEEYNNSYDFNLLTGRGVGDLCSYKYRNGRFQNSCNHRSIRFEGGGEISMHDAQNRAYSLMTGIF